MQTSLEAQKAMNGGDNIGPKVRFGRMLRVRQSAGQ